MIQFQDWNARNQLISEGIVYTVRNYRKSMGLHDAYYYQNGERIHICKVKIELRDRLISPYSKTESSYNQKYFERHLMKYLSLSGFQYMYLWIQAIKRYNKRELPDHAVVLRVTRVE